MLVRFLLRRGSCRGRNLDPPHPNPARPAPPGPHVEFMWGEYERLLPEFKHLMGRKGVKAPKITQPDPESSELAQAARRMEEADIEFARQAKAATRAKADKPAEA